MVRIEEEDLLKNQMLKKHNGRVYEVSKVYKDPHGKQFSMVQLKGVESAKGVPYTFVSDWLMTK